MHKIKLGTLISNDIHIRFNRLIYHYYSKLFPLCHQTRGKWEMTQIWATKYGYGVPYSLSPGCQFNYNALKIAFLLTGLTSSLLKDAKEKEIGGACSWGRVANSKMFISKVNDILKWHKLIISANERVRDKARKRQRQQDRGESEETEQIAGVWEEWAHSAHC